MTISPVSVPAPTPVPAAPLLSADELAARWSVSARTVVKLAASGDLHGKRIGRQWRFSEADANQYEQRGQIAEQ